MGLTAKELRKNDIEAEGFFARALFRDPAHATAKGLRDRILRFVDQEDNHLLRKIHEKHAAYAKLSRSDPQFVAKYRKLLVEFIHSTVAIEGNTMNEDEVREALKTKKCPEGKSLAEFYELLGMERAITLLTKNPLQFGRLDKKDLLSIQQAIVGAVDPRIAGKFRSELRENVEVGSLIPVGYEHVEDDLDKFLAWLNNPETIKDIDIVELAILAHYWLVVIHPFVDGNGRSCRLLMNWLLMSFGFPPLNVPGVERDLYRAKLNLANRGDRRPLLRYMAGHLLRSFEVFAD
ncbi:fic protein family protein [Aphelenchoides avenae]|nr:fic protein family protein [Aphelenchus avenae]